MKITLPAQILPPTLKKDGSATVKFETRELTPEEIMVILGARNTEGWLLYSNNNDLKESDIPKSDAEIDGGKSASRRLYDVLYVLYKQRQNEGKVTGVFDVFYREQMEKIIQVVKDRLHD